MYLGRDLVRSLVEDGDAQLHEGHGEVHGAVPLGVDGQISDGEVSFLDTPLIIMWCTPSCAHILQHLPQHPVPSTGILILGSVGSVIHPLKSVVKFWNIAL